MMNLRRNSQHPGNKRLSRIDREKCIAQRNWMTTKNDFGLMDIFMKYY